VPLRLCAFALKSGIQRKGAKGQRRKSEELQLNIFNEKLSIEGKRSRASRGHGSGFVRRALQPARPDPTLSKAYLIHDCDIA
jgi:hypothetical protein